jgi:hypothetical protein
MKNKIHFLFISFVLISLSACGIIAIEINENGYSSLKKEEKAFFKPFDASILNQQVNNRENLQVYEINSQQVKAVSKQHQYFWVHLWRPYCKADYCTNIKFFSDAVAAYPDEDMEVMLVSENYDLLQIKEVVKNSPYDRPIFVLDGGWYGSNTKTNKKQFLEEIKNNESLKVKNNGLWDDYFFKDSVLIFAGNHLDYAALDSLMKD